MPATRSFDVPAFNALRLMRFAPLERRAGGWRFGARRIRDQVIERLLAQGRIASDGERAWLIQRGSR